MTGLGSLRVDELILPLRSIKLEGGMLVFAASARLDRPRSIAAYGQPYELFGEDGKLVAEGRMLGDDVPDRLAGLTGDSVTLTIRCDISNVESASNR